MHRKTDHSYGDLCDAVRTGDEAEVALLQRGVNALTLQLGTLVTVALSNQRVPRDVGLRIASLLVKHGARVEDIAAPILRSSQFTNGQLASAGGDSSLDFVLAHLQLPIDSRLLFPSLHNSALVAHLLHRGAKPNVTATGSRETPLMRALEEGHYATASLLLRADADARCTRLRLTKEPPSHTDVVIVESTLHLLLHSTDHTHLPPLSLVQALVHGGADLELGAPLTVLRTAISCCPAIVPLLLAVGADASADGLLEDALSMQNFEVADALIAAGAVPTAALLELRPHKLDAMPPHVAGTLLLCGLPLPVQLLQAICRRHDPRYKTEKRAVMHRRLKSLSRLRPVKIP